MIIADLFDTIDEHFRAQRRCCIC